MCSLSIYWQSQSLKTCYFSLAIIRSRGRTKRSNFTSHGNCWQYRNVRNWSDVILKKDDLCLGTGISISIFKSPKYGMCSLSIYWQSQSLKTCYFSSAIIRSRGRTKRSDFTRGGNCWQYRSVRNWSDVILEKYGLCLLIRKTCLQ